MDTAHEMAQNVLSDLKRQYPENTPASKPPCARCKKDEPQYGIYCDDCLKHFEYVKRKAESLGGRRAFESYTFEKFVVTKENADAVEVTKAFDATTQNLFIYGPVGTGKTHLAVAASRKHDRVKFMRQSDLAREVRGCETASGEAYVIDCWVEQDIVILDDLGAAKDTEFMIGLLFDIIDGRYRAMKNGLIVTSNRTLDQLAEKLGEDRIPSRLAQMCKMVNLGGKDHRLEAKP